MEQSRLKNLFVVTLGTRDIQFKIPELENRSDVSLMKGENGQFELTIKRDEAAKLNFKPSPGFPGWLILKTPRKDGKVLLQYWEEIFFEVSHFPLFDPAFEKALEEVGKIDYILIVFTDQSEGFLEGNVGSFHYGNDTLFIAEALEKKLEKNFPDTEIDMYLVDRDVTNIDGLYLQFEVENKNIFTIPPESVGRIFLLPQGGIDQVNLALTLKLIEHFPGRVTQLQNAEGKEVETMNFPNLFIQNLNKVKILELLNRYEFAHIESLATGLPLIRLLATYARKRLALEHDKLQQEQKLIQKKFPEWMFLRAPLNELDRCRDLFLTVKICAHNKQYNELVSRLFTVHENLYLLIVERFIPSIRKYQKGSSIGKKPKWIDRLEKVQEEHPGLIDFLDSFRVPKANPKAKREKVNWKGGANRATCLAIASYFFSRNPSDIRLFGFGEIQHFFPLMELLGKQRHNFVHNLYPVNEEEINKRLGTYSASLDSLLKDVDAFFQIKGFDYLDHLKDQIENLIIQ